MANNSSKILEQLESLISEYERIRQLSEFDDLSDRKPESRILVARLLAAFQRISPPSSSYARDAENLRGGETHMIVNELAALAYSLRDDIRAGWISTLVELVHADTYADLIDMSRGLHRSGYKDAAAVISGTALELHIKGLADEHAIKLLDEKGRLRQADAIKSDLRKEGVLSVLQEKQVTYWLGVRNSAAHGSYGDYTKDDVSHMIDGVADFLDLHST